MIRRGTHVSFAATLLFCFSLPACLRYLFLSSELFYFYFKTVPVCSTLLCLLYCLCMDFPCTLMKYTTWTISNHLKSLAKENRRYVQLQNLGRSYEGRVVTLIKISANHRARNPIIFIDAESYVEKIKIENMEGGMPRGRYQSKLRLHVGLPRRFLRSLQLPNIRWWKSLLWARNETSSQSNEF